MSKIGDLFVRLGLKKDEFSKGLNEAKRETQGFGDKLKSMASVAKVAWAAVAAAVVKFATDAVKMTQKWGDEWKTTMAGVNAAYGSFVRQLSSGEGFTNLFANMREAARLAREAARELDEVFERTTSYNYTEANTQKEIAQLQLIMRDSSKSDKERMDAAQKIIQKTEELATLKKDIASQEADAYRKQLKSQTQLNDQEINFLVREYNQNKAIIDQGRAYLQEKKRLEGNVSAARNNAAFAAGRPGSDYLTQQWLDAKDALDKFEASTSQAVKDVAAMTVKYDKSNDELVANLGKAEVAVINVDTAMYHAQMRATSMLGSLSKAGAGGTTDTTDPAADAAAKIQQRAVDSAKSELHLLAEKYSQEKALLQQYGYDVTALTKEYEANTYKILSDYAKKAGLTADERADLVRKAYKSELEELKQAGLDTTVLTDSVMKKLLELSDESFQEFCAQLEAEFPIELEPIELDDTELQEWLDSLEAAVQRAEELAQEFGEAVAGGFSDACQEMMGQLMGLQDFNPGAIVQALLEPLADMAIREGEILIAEGIGVEACKKALESLNGYAAIAAGAALVMIGSAAKMGLAALAKSGGSTSTASTYQGGVQSTQTQMIESELTVYVEGRISGSDILLSGQRTVNSNNR